MSSLSCINLLDSSTARLSGYLVGPHQYSSIRSSSDWLIVLSPARSGLSLQNERAGYIRLTIHHYFHTSVKMYYENPRKF